MTKMETNMATQNI